MKLFIALVMTALAFPTLAETVVCSTKLLNKYDPHLESGPLESYLASQLYLPFFSTSSRKGVIKEQRNVKSNVWELTINPDLKFQKFRGWTPKRNLNAEDVAYSINRQLERFAISVAQKESFMPAKISGLEKVLESVKVKNPTTVELVFHKNVTAKDLESYFRFPMGIVVSREFADSMKGQSPDFFPSTGNFDFGEMNLTQWNLKAREGKDSIRFVALEPRLITAKILSTYKCKRLYYATTALMEAVNEKKINFAKIPISTSRLYFRLNPTFVLNKAQSEKLPGALHTDLYPSLSKRTRSANLFSVHPSSGKKSTTIVAQTGSAYVYYCDFPQLDDAERKALMNDFRKNIRAALGLEIAFAPLDCEQLAGIRPYPDTIGVLNVFEMKTSKELTEAFSCETISSKIFGFCQNGKSDSKALESKLKEVGKIYPLAHLESFMIESF